MFAGENPFRASRLHALPFLWPEEEDWNSLEARWREYGHRGSLAGPHGNGKSTLLTEWRERLQADGWDCQCLRLSTEAPRLPPAFRLRAASPGRRRCVILDGAEQLCFQDRLRFYGETRRAEGLILTSHRPGRLPVLLELHTDPARLSVLLKLLLEGDVSGLPASPEELLAAHGGDVRLVFRHLYDFFSCKFSGKGVE